ncbi:MAG: hypothetical protein Fur0041_18170 [Bacteroidia bacterium]
MKKSTLLFFGALFVNALSAQYCTTGGPSSPVDSNVKRVILNGQTGFINYTAPCPGVVGVQDLTIYNTTLAATSSYNMTVVFGTCNGNYAGAGEAWLDYDQSGFFDPWESVGSWQGMPTDTSVFSFTVPANAHNGVTRMRVMQREGGNVFPPLDPCGVFTWGSVMDFSITITGGLNCTGYIGDDTTDAIVVASIPYTDTRDNSVCYSNDNHAYPSPDVYYLVTPSPQTAYIKASLCGSSFDTFLSAIDKNGNLLAFNDDAPNCGPQSEITFNTAGIDTAYIIVEGWGSLTGQYTLNITQDFVGMNEYNAASSELYPNPANDYFILKGINGGTITVTDMSGKTVLLINNYQGEQISTASLADGIYFVRYANDSMMVSQKLVIAK